MCLWEVQEAYRAPHRYPGAVGQPGGSSQWNNGNRVHGLDIPLGAPVFWYNPHGWGHIAIYAGAGMVRSSDAGGRGRMGTVGIDWITRHWYPSGRFLGWTRDLGGVRIDYGTTHDEGNDDMTPEQAKQLQALYDAMFNGGTSMPEGKPLKDLIHDNFTAIRRKLS